MFYSFSIHLALAVCVEREKSIKIYIFFSNRTVKEFFRNDLSARAKGLNSLLIFRGVKIKLVSKCARLKLNFIVYL